MFSMRYFINLADSNTDESDSVESTRLETNINLEIGAFANEHEQLAQQFRITDQATVAAVRHYTHESTINSELIRVGGNPMSMPKDFREEYAKLISLQGTPLAEEHHTYSGTGTFNPMDVTVNGMFHTPAFLSTSLSLRVAVKTTNHRRDQAEAQEDHVLHFVLPAGFMDGFYVAPYSSDPEELEYLIFPNVPFRHLNTKVLSLGGVKRHVHSFTPR